MNLPVPVLCPAVLILIFANAAMAEPFVLEQPQRRAIDPDALRGLKPPAVLGPDTDPKLQDPSILTEPIDAGSDLPCHVER